MTSVLSLLRKICACFQLSNVERSSGRYRLEPVNGLFYVECISGAGEIRGQRIEAKHLVEKDGAFFLYGWCEKMPCFQSLPVEQITILADHETGEVIPREDVVLWLKKRILH